MSISKINDLKDPKLKDTRSKRRMLRSLEADPWLLVEADDEEESDSL